VAMAANLSHSPRRESARQRGDGPWGRRLLLDDVVEAQTTVASIPPPRGRRRRRSRPIEHGGALVLERGERVDAESEQEHETDRARRADVEHLEQSVPINERRDWRHVGGHS